MTVTQQGRLDPADEKRLLEAKAADDATAAVRDEYRRVAVEMMGKASIREVARLTGLSTNTLQRWKNEAVEG